MGIKRNKMRKSGNKSKKSEKKLSFFAKKLKKEGGKPIIIL